jgi:DNA polymerase-3 subunit delta
MAYQRKAPAVHAFKRIRDDLDTDSLKNILLFYGREDYLIRWSADKVKERYINPAVEMFDYMKLEGAECSADDIKAACETMPMMSEKRVVAVSDFDMAAEDSDELNGYFENFPDSTTLILISSSPDKRRKLFKTIQKYGAEYDFDRLDIPQFKSFIIKRFRNSGMEFDSNVPDMIAEASGYYDKDSDYTIDNLINDIDKIISHSSGRISAHDVEETISGNEMRDVFAFADALAAGRKGEALSLLSVLLSYGENTFKLLGLICSQFETVLLVNEMNADGLSVSQMHEHTGIHEFRIKKSLSLARRYTSSHLRRILMKAYEVDRNIKSGLSEAETALELLVAAV